MRHLETTNSIINGMTTLQLIKCWEHETAQFEIPGLDEIINYGFYKYLYAQYKVPTKDINGDNDGKFHL